MGQNLDENEKTTGVLGVFRSMLAGVGRAIIKSEISSKSNAFQLDLLELLKAAEDANLIKMYAELSESLFDCSNIFAELDLQGMESLKDETFYALIQALRNLLVDLFNQILKYSQYDAEDELACIDYLHTIQFWANMFYDANSFHKLYPYNFLQKMPDMWKKVIVFTEGLLESEEQEEDFGIIIDDFAKNICMDVGQLEELFGKGSLSRKDEKRAAELLDDIEKYTHEFLSALDRATDLLKYMLEG